MWPQVLQVGPGHSQNSYTQVNPIRWLEISTDQAIVERFNCMLTKSLFGHQYAIEMLLPAGEQSAAWVKKPPVPIKAVSAKPSTPYPRPVNVNKKNLIPTSMFAIYTSPVNSKVALKEPQA